ncbi:40S ribosomal protein S6 [Hypoxylon texense]
MSSSGVQSGHGAPSPFQPQLPRVNEQHQQQQQQYQQQQYQQQQYQQNQQLSWPSHQLRRPFPLPQNSERENENKSDDRGKDKPQRGVNGGRRLPPDGRKNGRWANIKSPGGGTSLYPVTRTAPGHLLTQREGPIEEIPLKRNQKLKTTKPRGGGPPHDDQVSNDRHLTSSAGPYDFLPQLWRPAGGRELASGAKPTLPRCPTTATVTALQHVSRRPGSEQLGGGSNGARNANHAAGNYRGDPNLLANIWSPRASPTPGLDRRDYGPAPSGQGQGQMVTSWVAHLPQPGQMLPHGDRQADDPSICYPTKGSSLFPWQSGKKPPLRYTGEGAADCPPQQPSTNLAY